MAIYEMNPQNYGLNFLGPGLGEGVSGLLSGLLQRQDPRNIEIRSAWMNPEAHMTDFGWAPNTPQQVQKGFDLVGGFVQLTDAKGNPVMNPATGQPIVKWDRRYQRKGTPLPEGYQILTGKDPYQLFPQGTNPTTPKPIPESGMEKYLIPAMMKPSTFESGGKVDKVNPIQALITLMEIDRKSRKGEVPAILHSGEGVVTKKGMKVLDKTMGGIDNLNALGESLPKMEKGGEVSNTNKLPVTWTLVQDTNGKMVWLPAYPDQTPGKSVEGITPFNEPKKQQTVVPPKDGALMQNEQGGLYWKPYNPYPTKTEGLSKKENVTQKSSAPVEKPKNAPIPAQPVNLPQIPPQQQTFATPGYRGWNAPTQYSLGQLQNLNPFQAAGIIQSDVESRGLPGPAPIYGASGQVLENRPTDIERRIGLQNALMNQYMGTVQAESEKVKTDWYPKEAQARLDQINNQIKYNNAMISRMGQASEQGLTPEDMLKLAQVNKINAELSQMKLSSLESAIKLSDKGNKRQHSLLMLEYAMTKYPQLAQIGEGDPQKVIDYLDNQDTKGALSFIPDFASWGWKALFGERKNITPEDVKNISLKLNQENPMQMSQSSNLLGQIYNESTIPSGTVPTPTPAPGTNTPIVNQLFQAAGAYGLK